MRSFFCLAGLSLVLGACAQLKPNPDPIEGIAYYNTKELQEKRASLQQSLSYYEGEPTMMTNRRKLGTLKDETADLYHRKLLQIERELQRRYEAGDKEAAVEADKAFPVQAAPAVPAPAPEVKPVP